MAFILRDDKRYSPAERRVFSLLPISNKENGGVTSTMIAARLYRGRINGRTIVVGICRSLIQKAAKYREPFRVVKTKRRGPHPSEFWVEGR